jgi:hypothetical protein
MPEEGELRQMVDQLASLKMEGDPSITRLLTASPEMVLSTGVIVDWLVTLLRQSRV